MGYKDKARYDFIILIKKLRDQDPELKKMSMAQIEEKVDAIIENIVLESTSRTIQKLRTVYNLNI